MINKIRGNKGRGWVNYSEMETFFSALFNQVFVGLNTGGFEGLRRDLFLFTRDDMDRDGENFVAGSLVTRVVDSESGVRHTSVIARLRVGLVLAVSVASSRSSSHFKDFFVLRH